MAFGRRGRRLCCYPRARRSTSGRDRCVRRTRARLRARPRAAPSSATQPAHASPSSSPSRLVSTYHPACSGGRSCGADATTPDMRHAAMTLSQARWRGLTGHRPNLHSAWETKIARRPRRAIEQGVMDDYGESTHGSAAMAGPGCGQAFTPASGDVRHAAGRRSIPGRDPRPRAPSDRRVVLHARERPAGPLALGPRARGVAPRPGLCEHVFA